jgi:hypothetical protein
VSPLLATNKKTNTMAKTTPKTAPKKSAAREFAAQDAVSAAPAPAKATRNRQAVLVKLTASKLHDLIGDQPIGVSRKELTALVTKASTAKVLEEAGL